MQGKQMGSPVKRGAHRGPEGLGRHSCSGRARVSPAGPSRGPRSVCEDSSVKTEPEDRAGSGQKVALYCREVACPCKPVTPHPGRRCTVTGRDGDGEGRTASRCPVPPRPLPEPAAPAFPLISCPLPLFLCRGTLHEAHVPERPSPARGCQGRM